MQSYSVFGFRYSVLGCISYNLDCAGGGHYTTDLFPNAIDSTVVHETTVKTAKRKPDFDSDTVIVCLKKVGECSVADCFYDSFIF
jgi:hypothetical protein